MGIVSLAGDFSIHPPTLPIPPMISVRMGDTTTVFVCGKPVALAPSPKSVTMFSAMGPVTVLTLVQSMPATIVGTVGSVPGPWTPAPTLGPGAPNVLMS